MKYRKRPLVIEAFQWRGEEVTGLVGVYNMTSGANERPVLCVNTLEGPVTASYGDYIIIGIKGEPYPCKPDIFEASYEAVEEEAK